MNPAARNPRHVAIIMDGNGRWAERRHRPRSLGHRAGARAVRVCLEFCQSEGVESLTLFPHLIGDPYGKAVEQMDRFVNEVVPLVS